MFSLSLYVSFISPIRPYNLVNLKLEHHLQILTIIQLTPKFVSLMFLIIIGFLILYRDIACNIV